MEPTDQNQQLGYLIAVVEEAVNDLKRIDERLTTLEDKVEEKFRTAETILKLLRYVGYALVAVLTFPWHQLKLVYEYTLSKL